MDLYKSSEITVHQLNELREENKKIQILDVREDTERDHAHIKGTIPITNTTNLLLNKIVNVNVIFPNILKIKKDNIKFKIKKIAN